MQHSRLWLEYNDWKMAKKMRDMWTFNLSGNEHIVVTQQQSISIHDSDTLSELRRMCVCSVYTLCVIVKYVPQMVFYFSVSFYDENYKTLNRTHLLRFPPFWILILPYSRRQYRLRFAWILPWMYIGYGLSYGDKDKTRKLFSQSQKSVGIDAKNTHRKWTKLLFSQHKYKLIL